MAYTAAEIQANRDRLLATKKKRTDAEIISDFKTNSNKKLVEKSIPSKLVGTSVPNTATKPADSGYGGMVKSEVYYAPVPTAVTPEELNERLLAYSSDIVDGDYKINKNKDSKNNKSQILTNTVSEDVTDPSVYNYEGLGSANAGYNFVEEYINNLENTYNVDISDKSNFIKAVYDVNNKISKALYDQSLLNSNTDKEMAKELLDFETKWYRKQAKNAERELDLQEQDFIDLQKYTTDKINNSMSDNIEDLKSAKEKNIASTRLMLGRGINDTAGVKILSDLETEYDKQISRVRRDNELDLKNIVDQNENTQEAYTLAREKINDNATQSFDQSTLNYKRTVQNIKTNTQNNTVEYYNQMRKGFIDYVGQIYSIGEEVKLQESQAETAILDKQIKMAQLKNLENQAVSSGIDQQIKIGNYNKSLEPKYEYDSKTGSVFNPQTGIVSPAKTNPTDVVIGSELRTGGTASWRNNNPGNIKYSYGNGNISGFAQQLMNAGIEIQQGSAATDGGSFITFPTLEAGMEGQRMLLQQQYSNLTVDAAMRKWSNNGYGGDIVPFGNKKTGQLNDAEFTQLIQAQIKREGFKEGKIISSGTSKGNADDFEMQRAISKVSANIPTSLKNGEGEQTRLIDFVNKGIQAGFTPTQLADMKSGYDIKTPSQIADNLRDKLGQVKESDTKLYGDVAKYISEGKYADAITRVENSLMAQVKKDAPDDYIAENGALNLVTQTNSITDIINKLNSMPEASVTAKGLAGTLQSLWNNTLGQKGNPIGNFTGTFQEWIGRFKSKDATDVASKTVQMLAAWRKNISGTAVTDNEKKYLDDAMPALSDTVPNFMSKLNSFKDVVMQKLNNSRSTVQLPAITEESLLNKNKRIALYGSTSPQGNTANGTSLDDLISQTEASINWE